MEQKPAVWPGPKLTGWWRNNCIKSCQTRIITTTKVTCTNAIFTEISVRRQLDLRGTLRAVLGPGPVLLRQRGQGALHCGQVTNYD